MPCKVPTNLDKSIADNTAKSGELISHLKSEKKNEKKGRERKSELENKS